LNEGVGVGGGGSGAVPPPPRWAPMIKVADECTFR